MYRLHPVLSRRLYLPRIALVGSVNRSVARAMSSKTLFQAIKEDHEEVRILRCPERCPD